MIVTERRRKMFLEGVSLTMNAIKTKEVTPLYNFEMLGIEKWTRLAVHCGTSKLPVQGLLEVKDSLLPLKDVVVATACRLL